MEDICRLCCSSKSVNNNIFDEENALYLKMSLYLPIKIFKNDRLPQKICDKCSCKVNDFYQFCNETIEVQDRLRSILFTVHLKEEGSVDVMRIKNNASPPGSAMCERSTQTDDDISNNDVINIKEEPAVVKQENATIDFDNTADQYSDNSEDMSLITLKQRKKKKQINGIEKKSKKKKAKLNDWELLMNALPEGTALTLVDKSNIPAVFEELPQDLIPKSTVSVNLNVKKEPNQSDIFHCCICFTQCYSRSEMLQHYREHAEQTPPVEQPVPPQPPSGAGVQRCTRCRKEVQPEQWAAHWHRHWARDRRPYRCALCERAYRDHHQILKHGMTHKYEEVDVAGAGAVSAGAGGAGETKRFLCDLCPERFVYMRYLLAHRTRAHPEAATRPLALRCGTCARDFAHLNSLRRHLRAHSGERNHLCNVCGKALSSREHLKFHIRIHTGYKPNVCKTCGKGFVKKCNLTLHERVHSGEKPHVCSHCGKAFSQRSTLVIHERYHSGARPYSCELCGRGFVAKGMLSMHLKTTCI